MKKENIRSKLTKEKIINTWFNLVENDKDNINIKKICEDAKINRSTFYTYFFDINDLINVIQNNIDEEIMDILSKEEKQDLSMRENLIKYLKYIKINHKKIYACLITSPNGFLKGKITNTMRQAIYHYYPKKINESNNIYEIIISFYQAGLYQIINKWILNDCREEIDDIVYAIHHCMSKSV